VSVRRDFPDLPPIWAAGILAVQALLAWLLPVWRFGPWAGPVGLVLVLAGVALGGWAGWWFRRRGTTIEPRERPTALIVEGPFRINRNPIYTAGLLCLLGAGLLMGALSAVVVAAFVFPFVITRRFILDEEAALRAAFGKRAERYIARTRRW
jgi:protein-S-isoprenylcysteine O-methyltransferase Ste14